MTYTIDDLWQAVYVFIPSFKKAREAGVNMNLPSSLNSAIIAWSALRFACDKDGALPNTLFINAANVLHTAHNDLHTHSQLMPSDNNYADV
jgi:hypothetical protein